MNYQAMWEEFQREIRIKLRYFEVEENVSTYSAIGVILMKDLLNRAKQIEMEYEKE